MFEQGASRSERVLNRDRVLRTASFGLAEARDQESVYGVAVGAALELIAGSSGPWAALLVGPPEAMAAVAVAGDGAPRPPGKRLDVRLLTAPLRQRLLTEGCVAVEGDEAAELADTLGPSRSWRSLLMVPVRARGERLGALVVAADSAFSEGIQDGLEALASQVALALQGVASAANRRGRHEEDRFRFLVQHASDIVWVVRGDGTLSYVSPSVERYLGYRPEELVGSVGFDLVHPDEATRARGFYEEVFENPGAARSVEARLRRKDGSWCPVESTVINLLDDPSVSGLVFSSRDVTESRQAAEALRQSEERYRAVIEQATEGIYLAEGETGRVLETNPAFEAMLGYTADELRGMQVHGFVALPPEEVGAALRRTLAERRRFVGEREYRRKDGTLVDVEVGVSMISYGGKEVVCAVARDITERKQAAEALRRSEERFRSLVQNASDVVSVIGADGTTQYVGPSIERVLGYNPEDGIGSSVFEPTGVHPDDVERVRGAFAELFAKGTGSSTTGELRLRHADGSWRYMEAIGKNLLDDPSVGGIVVNYRDITERKAFEEQLEHRAFHDDLTDLPNRALLMERLEGALLRADRRPGSVAVLFVDLDNFKVINDSLGHRAGDEVLVAAAGRIRRCLSGSDHTVARLSGDEFIVLLEGMADRRDALRLAGRIGEQMREPFHLEGHEAFTTTSIGIAFDDGDADRPDDLLRKADIAMYGAKGSGKSRYRVFDPGMDEEIYERLRLESDLRRAVERGEFVVHYQPKVKLDTNLQSYLRFAGSPAIVVAAPRSGGSPIVSVEALMRWEHPERGLVPPLEFIPLAEETGLIIPMGRWILREACLQARRWQTQRPGSPSPSVCVNLSGRQFQHPGLVEEVGEVLEESGLDPGDLVLEITESVLMEDLESTGATLTSLKGLGVKLAIDDFGTGYSSLSYLKRFPVDFIKIDRSFVERIDGDPADRTIVSAIVTLAHALDTQVVAEGVETPEQLSRLKAMGCDMAQGYHFSKPLPGEGMTSLLAARSRTR